MFGLYGKLKAHTGQREALIALLLKAADSLRELDGCYLYVINQAMDDADTIWVTEVWRSQADHQASLSHEAVKALIASGRPLIAEMKERIEVIPVGGKGLPDVP